MDPELAALAASAANAPPLTSLTIQEVRDRVDAGVAGAVPGPELHEVRDTDARGVPVREYRPRADPTRTLVYAHGGGWISGDLDYSDAFCRTVAARADCRVISVGYRLAPEHPHPAAADDVFDVLASSVSGGPVGIAGDSAGGHLAALAAVRARDAGVRLDFQALIYPAIRKDFGSGSYETMSEAFPLSATAMAWFWSHYAPQGVDGDPGLSPYFAPLSGVASAYLVAARFDPLHDDAGHYGARLREAGVDVTAVEFDTLSHGFLRFTAVSAAARAAQEQMCDDIAALFEAAETA